MYLFSQMVSGFVRFVFGFRTLISEKSHKEDLDERFDPFLGIDLFPTTNENNLIIPEESSMEDAPWFLQT